MKNIIFTRIDERLIHGQMMTSWFKIYDPNAILIIDDVSAKTSFLKRILVAAAPKDLDLFIYTTEEAIEYLKGDSDNEKLLIMAKTPKPLLDCANAGIEFKEINLGNMGGGQDRKRFNKNVNASDAEIADFKALVDKGVYIYMQMVPTDSKVDIKTLF